MSHPPIKWIAQRTFDCVDAKGKRFRAVARLGAPYLQQTEGKLAAYGRCPVSLKPLTPLRWGGGIDEFQALCLSIDLVRNVLKLFVARGGRVFFPKTDLPVNLDDPSFCPMADPDFLAKSKAKGKRAGKST